LRRAVDALQLGLLGACRLGRARVELRCDRQRPDAVPPRPQCMLQHRTIRRGAVRHIQKSARHCCRRPKGSRNVQRTARKRTLTAFCRVFAV
jgi:hypothetical protein